MQNRLFQEIISWYYNNFVNTATVLAITGIPFEEDLERWGHSLKLSWVSACTIDENGNSCYNGKIICNKDDCCNAGPHNDKTFEHFVMDYCQKKTGCGRLSLHRCLIWIFWICVCSLAWASDRPWCAPNIWSQLCPLRTSTIMLKLFSANYHCPLLPGDLYWLNISPSFWLSIMGTTISSIKQITIVSPGRTL